MALDSSHLARYLLGGLSEEEKTALEEQYVADPRLFDEIARVESDLMDDYVRGRLSPDTRERFERVVLADPRRRERLKFAEALLASVNGREQSRRGAAASVAKADSSRTWLGWLAAPKPALGFAFATLLIASGVWMVFEVRRMQRDALQRPATRVDQPPQTRVPEPARPATDVVVALAVGSGTRAPLSAPTPVVIPAGTSDVRLQLTLQENEYSAYRISVRQAGGAEIASRDRLTAVADGSAFVITVAIPASAFQSADYVLTLQGAATGGLDDLSRSLLRIDKQ
jgi:hypothetical protein